jgi:hypothetical protein
MGGMLRYFENKAILGVIQHADLNMLGKHRYDDMLVKENVNALEKEIFAEFPLEDAQRYIKFAIAAYGDIGIQSANLDLNHSIDLRGGNLTKTRISEYTGIPVDDIEVMALDYGTEPNELSHFVAVDHSKKKIILAIRGTHSQKLSNFNSYTKEFLGGEAHISIAMMAENVWKNVAYSITRLLHENPWYELIVTGHSLGGGVTCLINMLLHQDERMRGRHFRCFAFGSPPVYCPIDSVPSNVSKTCVTYINQYDRVPFTSGDTVRHQMAMIDAVDHFDLDLMQRARLILGLDTPNADVVKTIHSMQHAPWKILGPLPDDKQGISRGLGCPSVTTVWIVPHETDNNTFQCVLCDPVKIANGALYVHRDDFNDHLPGRYEYTLDLAK